MNDSTTFNNDLAGITGIEKAILLQRIYYFVEHNKNTGKHKKNDRIWMYDTAKAFCERFPFMKEGSVYRWLNELEKEGWIVSANFNKRKNDHTKWYSYGEKMIEFLSKSDSQNERPKKESVEPTPETASQNESPELFASQNERTDSQIERTTSQNESTLPGKSLVSPRKVPNNGNGKILKVEDDGYRSEGFKNFMSEYPRKEKEYTAWVEWLNQDIENKPYIRTKIYESLQAFKLCEDWAKADGRFIPFAHNWLRDRRYNEFPEAVDDKSSSLLEEHQTKYIGAEV